MFGLTFEKLLLIGVIAAFVLGPERLPHYAGVLAKFVRSIRDYANNAKSRMKEEMGPEFDDVDWRKLDPRQYDPRRIIREALLEDPPTKPLSTGAPRPQPRPSIVAPAAETIDDSLSAPSESAEKSREAPRSGTEVPAGPRFDTEAT